MSFEGSFFIVLIVVFLNQQVKIPLIIHFLGIDCFRIKNGGNCYLWQLKDDITGSWGCQCHNQGCLVRGTKLLPLGKPKQIGRSWKKWVKPGGKKMKLLKWTVFERNCYYLFTLKYLHKVICIYVSIRTCFASGFGDTWCCILKERQQIYFLIGIKSQESGWESNMRRQVRRICFKHIQTWK